jgi:hypothetical protein
MAPHGFMGIGAAALPTISLCSHGIFDGAIFYARIFFIMFAKSWSDMGALCLSHLLAIVDFAEVFFAPTVHMTTNASASPAGASVAGACVGAKLGVSLPT